MTHPDEDTLLKFVLGTPEEPEYSTVREHLTACSRCTELANKLRDELSVLKGVDFRISVPVPPPLTIRDRFPGAVLKMAAVLAIGFLLGYATALLSSPDRPIVVQQRLIPTSGPMNSPEYVTCPAVDVTSPPVLPGIVR